MSPPTHPRRGAPGRKLAALALALFLVGATSTALWISAVQFPGFQRHVVSVPALTALLLCLAFTTANLMIRWFRWHFLIRRFTPELVTRDSLAVYLATLPAIVTPFFVGELVRVLILRRRFRTPASYLVRIWLAERLLDVGVLATTYVAVSSAQWGVVATLLLGAGAWLLFRQAMLTQRQREVGFVAAASVCSTALAWAFPVVALWGTLRLLASPTSLAASATAFSAGTLFGGATGLPLGVFVTGSTMIAELVAAGVSDWASVLGILVHRAGTAWYAVILGLTSLVLYRGRLARLLRGQGEAHFDELADEYQEQIPVHVRDRLLLKKVAMIDRHLGLRGVERGARGLDLGCGQGWYLAEMIRRGYRVDGADYSTGQLEKAKRHLSASGVGETNLVRADAQALPFADGSYDFVYSINALHHILSVEGQLATFREVVRVLRPGGVFLLHEINVHNPIFRLYMGYLFPLLKRIDEGNEEWVLPTALPTVSGAEWAPDIEHFTFLPDFVPSVLMRALGGTERRLERSPLRRFSAHYQACLVKQPAERVA